MSVLSEETGSDAWAVRGMVNAGLSDLIVMEIDPVVSVSSISISYLG
jgi:hypothetical protein